MAQLKQVCTVTNGSQTVTVIGVNVAYRIRANNIFMVSPDLVPYTVAQDATFDGTNTVVQLTGAYQGPSGAMAQGAFVTDFTSPDNIPLISQGDVGTAAIWTKAMYQLQEMIGSVTPAGLTAFIAQINATEAAADASAAAALVSQNAAKTSETNSKTSETNSAASKTAALTSQNAAKTSETNSKTSETNSAASAAASATSATASANSATASAASKTAAATSEANSSSSAAAALASKTAAATSESNSAASAAASLASQNAAKTSETNAKTSETNSKTSETNAASSKTAAAGSATAAAGSATAAAGSATSAASDRATVQGILSSMNELYLGNKATAPTVDNNGNTLKLGAEYFDTTKQLLRVYTSTGWQDYDKDAQTQAVNATASASAAAGSASGAATSAANAHTSEVNSAASAAAALVSQNAAKTSETNSKTSETNSKASETNSKTSETNSKASENAAAASAAHADQVAAAIGNPVSKDGDTMAGDLWVGNPASTSGKTLGTNYRMGVARNAPGNYPYAVIANGTLAVASPPASQTTIGSFSFRWASTTSDVLAGQGAADIYGYANADGTGDLGLFARNAANSITGQVRVLGNGRVLVGTSTDNGADKLQVNGTIRGAASTGALRASNGSGTGQTGIFVKREDAPADEKTWEILHASSGSFVIRSMNDAYSASQNALVLTRPTGGGIGITTMQLMNGGGRVLVGTSTDDGATLLQVAGTLKASGSITTAGALNVDGAAGAGRSLYLKTAGSNRWEMAATATAEGGSNAGSNLALNRYSDTGTWIDSPLSIARSTGIATLSQRPIFGTAVPWDSANVTPFDKALGGTISAPTVIDAAPSATNAHLSLRGSSGALSTEAKLRFHATFGSGSDLGQRMVASIRAGFNAGTWGKEYLDFYLNSASNDAATDANQTLAMRLTYGGRLLIGSTTDDGSSKLQVNGAIRAGGTAAGRYFANSATNVPVMDFGVGTLTGLADSVGLTTLTSTGALDFGTNTTQRLRITSTGRVLVGTTTDDGSSLLQVAGGTSMTGGLNVLGGSFEFGSTTAVMTPFIDFHSSGVNQDFDSRIIASGGISGTPGAGTLQLQTGQVIIYHGSMAQLKLSSGTYVPVLRSNLASSAIEFVNSANTAVNFTVNDAGTVTARSTVYSQLGGASSTGAFRTTGDFGGAFVDWNNNRNFALQIDSANAGSAYGGIRWTRWGGRHLAAIEAYEGGSTSAQPTIVFHVANQNNAWTFSNNDITRGAGGYLYGTWNFNPSNYVWKAGDTMSNPLAVVAGGDPNGYQGRVGPGYIKLNEYSYGAYIDLARMSSEDYRWRIHYSFGSGQLEFLSNGGQGINFLTDGNIYCGGRGYVWDAINSKLPTSGGTLGYCYMNGGAVVGYQYFGYLNNTGASTYTSPTNNGTFSLIAANMIAASQVWAVSDARLKTEIEDIEEDEAIEFVQQVAPKRYMKEGVRERGFIAQDVGKALKGKGSELLTLTPREELEEQIDEDGFVSPEGHALNVSHNQIIPIHASVLRNLLRRVEALEAALAEAA